MDNQTPQTQSGAGSLDPDVVNLSKAFRQVESDGDFQAKGKSGEYGAYQNTPATWAKRSADAGINVSFEQASPEQQNEVFYKWAKGKKDAGYNVGQIASMQIAGEGEPDGYIDEGFKGTNKYGASYDVPKYAQQVAQTYQSLKGPQGTQPAQPAQSQSGSSFIPTANAASGPSTNSAQSSGPDWTKLAEGLGLTVGGGALLALPWLLGPEVGAPVDAAEIAAGGGAAAGNAGFLKNLFNKAVGGVEGFAGAKVADTAVNALTGSNKSSGTTASNSSPSQDPFLSELLQSSQASGKYTGAVQEAMQGTQSNRVFSDSSSGQQGIQTMGMHGYAPDIDKSGVMDFKGARESADKNIGKAADIETLAAKDSTVPMASVLNEAGNYLGQNRMLAPDKKQKISEMVGEYARAYAPSNSSIAGDRAIQARHQQYKATKGKYGTISSDEIEARKALAHGFRQASLKNSKNPQLQEAAIKEQQRHINAQAVMKRLDQKRAPMNHGVWKGFMQGAARYAEIWIGDKLGGPIGAVLGSIAGEHLNKRIERKFGRNIFETKQMKAALDILRDAKPNVYEKLKKKLQNEGIKISEEDIKIGQDKSVKGLIKDVKTGGTSPVEIDKAVNAVKKKGLINPDRLRKTKAKG